MPLFHKRKWTYFLTPTIITWHITNMERGDNKPESQQSRCSDGSSAGRHWAYCKAESEGREVWWWPVRRHSQHGRLLRRKCVRGWATQVQESYTLTGTSFWSEHPLGARPSVRVLFQRSFAHAPELFTQLHCACSRIDYLVQLSCVVRVLFPRQSTVRVCLVFTLVTAYALNMVFPYAKLAWSYSCSPH